MVKQLLERLLMWGNKMGQKVSLTWDGETIKQQVKVDDMKLTPKQVLDSLDSVRNQITQMEGQKEQAMNQIEGIDKQIKDAKGFEKDRAMFEKKCLKIQGDKLMLFISQIQDESKEKALNEAKETIAKDPNAYSSEQKKNMSYLNYQKLLATNEKIAERISRRVITDKLYDFPVFDNPFE